MDMDTRKCVHGPPQTHARADAQAGAVKALQETCQLENYDFAGASAGSLRHRHSHPYD